MYIFRESEMEKDLVIVGAGIAGLATAVALKRIGVEVLVLEKSKGLRTTGAALTLFPNGWFALNALHIADKLTTLYAPCNKGYITNLETGQVREVCFSKNNRREVLRVVHRKALLKVLAEELPKDAIQFCCGITSIEEAQAVEEGPSIAIIHMEGGDTIKTKAVVGCDGVNSMVARGLGLPGPVNSGRWAARGLAILPQGHGLDYEFQQMVTTSKRAGYVPLNDKELYWFLIISNSIDKGNQHMKHNPKSIQKEVLENLAKDLPPLFSTIVRSSDLSTLSWAPVLYRLPRDVLLGPLNKNNITIAGDAMHPMAPDLGQNECAALEDAVVLAQQIGRLVPESGEEISTAFERYVEQRRRRIAGLMAMSSSLCTFVEQGGSRWVLMQFLRKVGLFQWVFGIIHYNCGELPCVCASPIIELGTKIVD